MLMKSAIDKLIFNSIKINLLYIKNQLFNSTIFHFMRVMHSILNKITWYKLLIEI